MSATGFHFLTLLEGKADCAMLLRAGTKKWDSCAGEALLRARGGCVTDAAGRLYDYGDGALALNRAGLISSRDARTHFALVDAAMASARETEGLDGSVSNDANVGNTFYPLNARDPSRSPRRSRRRRRRWRARW